MKKKIFLTLLMIALCVCLFAICASAAVKIGDETNGYVYYDLSKNNTFEGYDGTATVSTANRTSEDTDKSTHIVIPEVVEYDSDEDGVLEKYVVTAVASEAFGNNSSNDSPSPVVSITIPRTVKTIGTHAFRKLTALTTVIIKAQGYNPVTGETSELKFTNAEFYQTKSLVSVDMSESNIIQIGSVCFQGCSGLETALFSSSIKTIGSGAFSGCTSLTTISSLQTVEKIEGTAFQENNKLKGDLNLNNLTSLGNNAFQNCKAITSVDLSGATLTEIPQHAFHTCSALTTVKLPEGLLTIGTTAFVNCKLLTSCNIPSSLTSIGNEAFYQTAISGDLVLGNLTTFGSRAFRGTNITSIDFTGSTFSTLSDHEFRDCKSLTKVVLPDTEFTSIPQYAFSGCSSLTSINIPSSIRSFGNSAFWGPKITGDIVVDYLESIGDHAFRETSITSFIAKNGSATTIGSDATFYKCTNLKYIVIPTSVTTIPKETFTGCNALLYIVASKNITTVVSKPPKADIIIRDTSTDSLASVFSDWTVAPFSEFNPETAGTKTIYYGAKNIEGSTTMFTDFSSFDNSFSTWDATTNTKTSYDAVVEVLGYSTKNGGTGIATGFKINQASVDAYKSIFGGDIKFGIVVFNPKFIGDTFFAGGKINATQGAIQVELVENYSTLSAYVAGFDLTKEAHQNLELVFAGYAYTKADKSDVDLFQKEYVGTQENPVSSPMQSKVTKGGDMLYTVKIQTVTTHTPVSTGKEGLNEFTAQ